MIQCPCGSRKEYLNCCGLLIDKKNNATNPEALMRSRYTAYTKAEIDYIKETMRGKPLQNFNEMEAMQWAKGVIWTGLEVLASYLDESDENLGYVEFIASFQEQGKKQAIHELSKFQCIEGQWFYIEGLKPKLTKEIKKPAIARNAACPCGSQKKYKNCHGR